jgi:hypothetical protein
MARTRSRSLEVERYPACERGEPLDLPRLGPGHELHVDVAGEAVPLAQQLQRGNELVHDPDRIAGDAGRDEQAVHPSAVERAEEDPHQLLGLE